MSKYYVLSITYPFDQAFAPDEIAISVVGVLYTDAGAGFGMRDLQWNSTQEFDVGGITSRLKKAAPDVSWAVSEEEFDE